MEALGLTSKKAGQLWRVIEGCRVKLDNLLQTSARIMRSSLYGQRIPAQFCNTEQKCLISTKKKLINTNYCGKDNQ